jgi:hypothetical protein
MHAIELNCSAPATLPVLDALGRHVGFARSAKDARQFTSEAMLCKVNGAVVFAAPGCSPKANWSLVPKH